ncbi:hypothetical protein HAX54_033626 [Datura stramonium]|uniref:Uncharacterized protein n=1 Tax=Datura stramonium TaxID=4076 RepID=A0ABS8VCL7_DATST|nr:hypothetical protein [Datura stramonium]
MPKRDLDVDSPYKSTTERNDETEAIEDLFLEVFFKDSASNIEAWEDMHLSWHFLDDKSDMDTRSLNSDWKEVLSGQACSDTILSNIVTSCDLWLNWERNKKEIMTRMRTYDHMKYLVNCHIATQLEVVNYQISSPYFTLENMGSLKNKGCTQFTLLQSSAPSLGKTSSTSFGQNKKLLQSVA